VPPLSNVEPTLVGLDEWCSGEHQCGAENAGPENTRSNFWDENRRIGKGALHLRFTTFSYTFTVNFREILNVINYSLQVLQSCVIPCPEDCVVSDWSSWGPCHWPCDSRLPFGRRFLCTYTMTQKYNWAILFVN